MGNLIAELGNPPKRSTSFPEWLVKQPPEVREALEVAAADERWSTFALVKLLSSHGASCSRESVLPWRIKHGYVVSS